MFVRLQIGMKEKSTNACEFVNYESDADEHQKQECDPEQAGCYAGRLGFIVHSCILRAV
jgi:hypothetical protein